MSIARRSYHLRLGFIRVMRFYVIDHKRLWLIPMRKVFGWDIGWRSWHVQVAWYWWGFGRDPR